MSASSLFRPKTLKSQQRQDSRERRVQPRFTSQFRSTFSGRHEEGQGRTIDISLSGCKIEGDITVEVGTILEFRLHVPDLDWPLRIDEAKVQWVNGTMFGVLFSRLLPEEEAKLKMVIANLQQGA